MNIMPDVVPVSHLRNNHRELFHQLEEGPVILAQRSKPAAVLVSVAEWNAKERRLEILEARLRYLEVKQQFEKEPPRMVTFDEIETNVKARR